MTFASWLKRLPWVATRKTKPIRKSAKRRPGFKPQVEQLETRLAPANTITVNTNADANQFSSGSYYTNGTLATGSIISLRSALEYSNKTNFAGNIDFSNALGTATINLSTVGTNGNLSLYISDTSSLTIDGSEGTGAAKITVSGQNNTSVIDISAGSPTIKDLTITGGKALGSTAGGLTFFGGGTCALTSDTFSSNSGNGQPAGAISFSGTLNVTSCAFNTNSATTGGAIYMGGSGTLNLTNSSFTGNSVTKKGGAIYISAGTVNLSGNTFTSNKATGSGGAIYVKSGTFKTTGSDTFSGNTSSVANGGAIMISGGSVTITNDNFDNSSGSGNMAGVGGAIANFGGTLSVSGTKFSNNSGQGGAVYVNSGTATFSGDTFTANTTISNGGAVYLNSGTATFTNDIFTDNTSTSSFTPLGEGGALFVSSLTTTVTSTGDTFSGNTATNSGGAIYNEGTLTLTDDTFDNSSGSGNSAKNGGAIYSFTGTLKVVDSTFSTNKATSSGGAVYQDHGTATLTGDTFSANTASDGAAIYVLWSNAVLTADDSTFTGNTASFFGGAIFNSNGSLSFACDTITKNSAPFGGGILGHSDGNIKVFDTILDGNTATTTGADVYNQGTFTSSGGNLYGGKTGTETVGVTWKTSPTAGALYPDVKDTADNPDLDSLANNGGYTETMAPLPGSLALGNGNPVTTLTTDQRGFARVVNGQIDIGALQTRTWTVTTDDGKNNTPGSLRYIVDNLAQGGDTIVFASSLSGSTGNTINLNGAVSIGHSITIDGSGADITVDGNTGGNGYVRCFNINSNGGVHPSITIEDLTITRGNGAGGPGGNIANNSGNTLTLIGDTITNSQGTTGTGGGIYNSGTLYVTDCTIANNSATFHGGGIYNAGTAYITNSTITRNNIGGAIYNFAAKSQLQIYDTIVAGNTNGDIGGSYTNSGGNFIGGSPDLGSLQNNGGSTDTIAPLPGSPVLGAGNTGNPSFGILPAADQRGFSRIANGKIDIGAFQNQSQLFALTGPSAQTATAGTLTSFSLGTLTYSGNTDIVDVSWGDGSADTIFSSTNANPLPAQNHTYAFPGNFTITITVKDPYNDFAQTTGSVTVGGTLRVNTTNDVDGVSPYSTPYDKNSSPEISLRSAIEYFNANNLAGTIGFVPGLSGTIGIKALGTLNITDTTTSGLTIDGSGANITVSGQNLVQVFSVGVPSGTPTAVYSIRSFNHHERHRPPPAATSSMSRGNLTLSNDTITNGRQPPTAAAASTTTLQRSFT